eukprot:TRINITY_DN3432_c0_g1_i1.p1 TRINITY_DN3432_c0_g1~~TRINITY_DN3432_c0_g1_i1.p1  ORF type:complete len:526 (-),score=88.13 TRINITY_DN3432_c0_g1_i1:203-1780(-)
MESHAKCFAFIFPMASGHVNPSLPIARWLTQAGHKVHYLCLEPIRESIEDTGAIFHSAIDHEAELYNGRDADVAGALNALKQEHGMHGESFLAAYQKLRDVQLDLQLPGVLRFLQLVKPDAVVYCPVINREASIAALLLGIPSIALLTFAGPGARIHSQQMMLDAGSLTVSDLDRQRRNFHPNIQALARLRSKYGLHLEEGLDKPFGRIDAIQHSVSTLVTTSEELQDPMSSELASTYAQNGSKFVYVGPLLDQAGARRAGAHGEGSADIQEGTGDVCRGLPDLVRSAREAGRKVVLVSMGTVITGNTPGLGWSSRPCNASGQPYGLTGKQLCHASWSGAFDAFGSDDQNGPLILVATGPQPEPLAGLEVPPNTIAVPSVPQVDILKAGVDVFLTHCGQNSFMEALANATPVVCCPGFGDQIVNGRKAAALGVGLNVERPHPPAGEEDRAASLYRRDVGQALRQVVTEASFRASAARCAENLGKAGGVPRAANLILAAAQMPAQSNKASSGMSVKQSNYTFMGGA